MNSIRGTGRPLYIPLCKKLKFTILIFHRNKTTEVNSLVLYILINKIITGTKNFLPVDIRRKLWDFKEKLKQQWG